MVVKRPKRPTSQPGQQEPDVELLEHLVKKSLDVNPQFRDGKSTHEVLSDLKQQAVARSKTAGGTESAPAPGRDLAQRRRGTIAFFFEQKAAELEEILADITARERLLRKEKEEAQQRITEDLVDFLALMSGVAETAEGRDVLRTFRQLFAQLGISDAELVALVRRADRSAR